MDSRLGPARRAARRSLRTGLGDLESWLSIPSVSGDPAHRHDVTAAARWVAARLRGLGATVTVLGAPGGPVVLARARGTSTALPGVVLYGHLDVKPAGQGWTSPPFRPVRRGSRLVARGASDDKGQTMAHLLALRAWTDTGGLPYDVTVIVDGAEEIGSPGLGAALRSREAKGLVKGPVAAVVVSDTRSAGPGRPSITVSQRGMLSVTVVVDVGGTPLHAGRFGGAVHDPGVVLARSLQAAEREVSGWHDAANSRRLGPSDAAVRAAAGKRATLPGPAHRSTVMGALSVPSIRAGGTPGSIPTRATAILDVRTPPGVEIGVARGRLVAALRSQQPPGVTVEVRFSESVPGVRLQPPEGVAQAVRSACCAGFGVPPVALASGASIPAVHTLRSELGTAPVLLGFGPADDGAHGPDEHLELDDWGRAIDTMVVLLDRLAASSAVRVAGSHPRATLGAHRVVTRDQAEPVAPWPGAEPGHQVGTGEAADVSW